MSNVEQSLTRSKLTGTIDSRRPPQAAGLRSQEEQGQGCMLPHDLVAIEKDIEDLGRDIVAMLKEITA